ncbi:MAG: hypothetical protein R6U58_01975 [Bacteroidales bacterium]
MASLRPAATACTSAPASRFSGCGVGWDGPYIVVSLPLRSSNRYSLLV